ncbi:MAG TPA: hypothetical protein EYQ74_03765 [Planctomycetes bacterium]|nr:hypothetical protein [Planctomycetota bacterium]HIK59866.1 hypothetical protein [Planctomycetota bacterium]
MNHRPLPFWPLPALGLIIALTGSRAQAQNWDERPDGFAPIGISTDGEKAYGAWTFSYQNMRTDGSGLLDGRGQVTSADVFADGYAASPQSATREAHNINALFGYSESTSLLLTLPFLNNEVTMRGEVGQAYELRSTGMGDLNITSLFQLGHAEDEVLHAQLGVSLPTGSRDERGVTPLSGGISEKLPYSLQLSSGTLDLIPGITYVKRHESTSLGFQAKEIVRFKENSDNYQLGNVAHLSGWVSRVFNEDVSGSLRLGYRHEGRMKGQDPSIDPTQSPMHDPNSQGGDRVTVWAGVNYIETGGHSFGFELGGPLWQDLNGPQLEQDLSYALGWHYSF